MTQSADPAQRPQGRSRKPDVDRECFFALDLRIGGGDAVPVQPARSELIRRRRSHACDVRAPPARADEYRG